jgi:uncharacterized membrane protein YdjX (TVP38/TMEM64 family)
MIDKAKAVEGTIGAFLGLTWIAVILRIYVRVIIVKKLQLSDYFVVITQVCQRNNFWFCIWLTT